VPDSCTSGSTCADKAWALRRKWHCKIPETPKKSENLHLMAQSIALCLTGEFRPGLLGSLQQLHPRDVALAAKPSCTPYELRCTLQAVSVSPESAGRSSGTADVVLCSSQIAADDLCCVTFEALLASNFRPIQCFCTINQSSLQESIWIEPSVFRDRILSVVSRRPAGLQGNIRWHRTGQAGCQESIINTSARLQAERPRRGGPRSPPRLWHRRNEMRPKG